jgi:hypothetical protein
MTAQTPYQKFLAYMFPSTWNWLSSKISPKNIEASVLFEKSIPEAFKGESVGAPPIIIVFPISMLAEIRICRPLKMKFSWN